MTASEQVTLKILRKRINSLWKDYEYAKKYDLGFAADSALFQIKLLEHARLSLAKELNSTENGENYD